METTKRSVQERYTTANGCWSCQLDNAACSQVKVGSSHGSPPALSSDGMMTARVLADRAVKMHKIFTILGPYPVIRAGLRARGWVEQRAPGSKHKGRRRRPDRTRANHTDDSASDADSSDDAEKPDTMRLHEYMSHLVQNEKVYFFWTNSRNAINPSGLHKDQIINHFEKAGSFTTKVGLCVNLRNLHWFDSANPDTFFPRCYRLGAQDERNAFIEDYRRTACTSLLKYIVEMDQGAHGEEPSYSIKCHKKPNKGRRKPLLLSKMISTALNVCQEFLGSFEHKDIETSSETSQSLSQEEWAEFIDSYYLLLHGGAELEGLDHLVACCNTVLQRLKEVSPQLDMDGIHNIWIIKPGAKSRGRGIKCAKRLDQILRLVDSDPAIINERKWVVQKYLERPLLVHGTKFDVRQWFLVTDWNPLTVWFYKKCYLRFSTQPYSLNTLDSSVHLCNNSIQKHLTPSQQRHRGLPSDNMWSDDQFRDFLCSQGREALWESVVVPGMKSAVIYALQSAQNVMESRKNTFELFGADFLLGRDLQPWLIEINASPTMAPSTSVTAHLCAAVQEDTLRVILDRNANTGDFQLIFKQAAVDVPLYGSVSLLVEGFAIKGSCPLPPLRAPKHSAPKHRGPIKEKDPAEERAKSLPKVNLRLATNLLGNTGSTTQLRLPKSASQSIQLPVRERSHAVLLWSRRAEASKVCSKKVQPCTAERQGLSLSVDVSALTQFSPVILSP